jgi:predicted DNA-binding transcriptional regulator YafY
MMRRIEFVNYLIKKKATGNLDNLAKKNNISKRAMTDFLNQLRDMGADIKYDRIRRTYYYAKNGEISACKFLEYGKVLTRDESAAINKPEELCFSERAIFVRCSDDELVGENQNKLNSKLL